MVICSPLGVGMPLMTGVVKCFEKLGTSVQDRSHWNFSIQLKITHHKGSCHWRSQSGTSGCKSAPKKFKKSVKSHFCGSSKKKNEDTKTAEKKEQKWKMKSKVRAVLQEVRDKDRFTSQTKHRWKWNHTHKELPSNQRHTEMKNCFNCRLELNNHGLALTD